MSADVLEESLRQALDAFAARPRVLVALDFDGVLAPIVEVPGDARPLPASRAPVERLLAADGVEVALVSGRALADLRTVADPPGDTLLVGSHGAEVASADAGELTLDDDTRARLDEVVAALRAIERAHPGTSVELKPAGAVLHTRRAARPAAAAATRQALDGVATWDGVHVTAGKEVVELSVVRAGKGLALDGLRKRLGVDAVFYAGDDVTDENAFAVLDPARGDVRLKVGDGETAAEHRVADPEQVVAVLEHLAAARSRH
jgi:trehalose 6-phosphate phosphatase